MPKSPKGLTEQIEDFKTERLDYPDAVPAICVTKKKSLNL
jgi:hypothetical protein